MTTNASWFTVDRAGLAKQLADMPTWRLISELLQNAWDEQATRVVVSIDKSNIRGYYDVCVEDDNPNGFADLSHAWTLFAPSTKSTNAEKRGRFNLGEKLLLAGSRSATITTTSGMVRFDSAGRSATKSHQRPAGSSVFVTMKISDLEETIDSLHRLIAPIPTTINGVLMQPGTPLKRIPAKLPTMVANEQGDFARTERMTEVVVYPVTASRPAAIYEMGIPVVDVDLPYSLDVQQKVPLNRDRDNVTPAYLQQLRVLAFNAMYEQLKPEEFKTDWARAAAGDERAEAPAVTHSLDQRFGTKRVAYDPSDPEANRIAMSKGYTVVHGGSLSGGEWTNARSTTRAAGQVTPSPKPYSPDGSPLVYIEPTASMLSVAKLAFRLARSLNIGEISVRFTSDRRWPFRATFGQTLQLVFNAGTLTPAWFDLKTNRTAILDLLIHEFGHYDGSGHLTEAFDDNLTRFGARMTDLALTNPEIFRVD
jgi:hypothetical protein